MSCTVVILLFLRHRLPRRNTYRPPGCPCCSSARGFAPRRIRSRLSPVPIINITNYYHYYPLPLLKYYRYSISFSRERNVLQLQTDISIDEILEFEDRCSSRFSIFRYIVLNRIVSYYFSNGFITGSLSGENDSH